MKMEKPILFNTKMVQAILEGRKTQTRRILKLPKYVQKQDNGLYTLYAEDSCYGNKGFEEIVEYLKPPYQIGDILYVRETWSFQPCSKCEGNCDVKAPDYLKEEGCFAYRTNYGLTEGDTFPPSTFKWHPSIHMPKSAARIFLKVTDVKVEKLQDITEEEALKEGFIEVPEVFTSRELFEATWNTIYKNWNENPWVWAISFEVTNKSKE